MIVISLALALALALVLVAGGLFFAYFYRLQTTWVESLPYQRDADSPTNVLVVHYSRTGNTRIAAKEIAKYFHADMLAIEAPQYGTAWSGQNLAATHADQKLTSTPIEHPPVDLERYDLIFLCSPTWWFRPAIPLWSFVENHSFNGRSVFLFLTGNSRYKEELTRPFGQLVEEKNGKFLGMEFLRRGRIYWQMNTNGLKNETRVFLNERAKLWERFRS